MEHLNYCRQMVKQAYEALSHPQTDERTTEYLLSCIRLAGISEKFMLPPGGRIIDDKELKALDDSVPLNLPFEHIALEIPSAPWVGDLPEGAEWIPKSILFARINGEHIFCTVFNYSANNGTWRILDSVAVSRSDYMIRGFDEGMPGIKIQFPRSMDEHGYARAATANCVWSLISFLNALACSNVHIERSEPKSDGKKIKSALPFDAYHFLIIDVPGVVSGERTGRGDGRSPREHLRRGHIRRLADGRRIWVNATVVNAGIGGKVSKDYRLRARLDG